MAGALTERDFVTKLEKAGFHDIRIHARQPLSIDDLALYPLFTPDLLALMRRHIPPAAQTAIGTVVVVSARAKRDVSRRMARDANGPTCRRNCVASVPLKGTLREHFRDPLHIEEGS